MQIEKKRATPTEWLSMKQVIRSLMPGTASPLGSWGRLESRA